MKQSWIVILAFLFVTINVESRVAYIEIDSTDLWNVQLKSDEPLQTKDTYKKLTIYNSNGTIGVKTFSQVPHVEQLTLSQSGFTSVEDGALCTPPKLEILNLHSIDSFRVLTQSLLTNCENLKSFSTGNVQMKADALKYLVKLESVTISGQHISHFTKEYLEPLTNLKEFTLYGSTIEQIDPASICLSTKLHTIKFQSNNVTTPLAKGIFENCGTVEYLDYLFNEPDTKVEDGAFTGLTNLKRVRFSFLNYKTLSKGFLLGLSNVEELVIYRARVEKIAADTFDGFNNLKELRMFGTRLEEIDSGAFSLLPKLIKLDVSENKLTTIDNISNPHLETLDAHWNNISNVTAETLKGNLPNLKGLIIYSNPVVQGTSNKDALKEKLLGINVA